MTRILFIAPGNNPHTWKWAGWFGRKYPGEIKLIPYQDKIPKDKLPGVEILDLLPQFIIASVGSWSRLGGIKKLVHDISPDVLHVLWAYGSGTYGAHSDYHPTILSPWGSDITVYPNRSGIKGMLQRRMVLKALESADHITATSKFLASEIHKLVPNRGKPPVYSYGVDTGFFNPESISRPMMFPWPDGAPIGDQVITVGFFKSLESAYGPEFLIEAISQASQVVSGLRCVMAGSGSMKEELVDTVRSHGLENRFVFTGRIPYEDMPRAMASIDIFAMPSRYEVLGVAALEASAMEIPVIVTNKWGMTEVARHKETGFYLDEGDVEMLADYLVVLSRDRMMRREMGVAGRKFVKENFEFDTILESMDKFIYSVIKKK